MLPAFRIPMPRRPPRKLLMISSVSAKPRWVRYWKTSVSSDTRRMVAAVRR